MKGKQAGTRTNTNPSHPPYCVNIDNEGIFCRVRPITTRPVDRITTKRTIPLSTRKGEAMSLEERSVFEVNPVPHRGYRRDQSCHILVKDDALLAQ